MQIDPSQPILFDYDSPPGKGTGMWQINPFFDSGAYGRGTNPTVETPFERRVRIILAVVILVILAAASGHMLLS